MKKSKQCPKCESLKIGHLEYQVDRSTKFDQATERVLGFSEEPGWLADTQVKLGRLEAYLCGECGYYESYVIRPKKVEWDKLTGFRWVNPSPQDAGPYR